MIFKLLVSLAVAVAAQTPNNSLKEVQQVEDQHPHLPSLLRASVSLFQGREKKGDQGLTAATMLGATMAAMGLAALAALSGKAIAASMAALLLAAAALMRKHSEGAHSYELVAHHGHRSIHDGQATAEVEPEHGPVSRLYRFS